MREFLLRYSYFFLSIVLISIQSVLILKSDWKGDFWEHAAVVKELSSNFFHPSHPILNVDAPHAFFSPYTLLVALFSKLSTLDARQSLQCFAFINLVFFLIAFRFFCIKIFPNYADSIASLALIFILLFWGASPLLWSGFYHIFVLNYILPYPSTFSLCLAFLTIGLFSANEPRLNLRTFLITILIAVSFLTHPYTGIFLAIVIVALIATWYGNSLVKSIFVLLIIGIMSFILCCLWPYYDFLNLVTDNNGEFHKISKAPYLRIPGIYWPLVLIIPLPLLFERSRVVNFLILSIIIMLGFYSMGYFLDKNGFGRIISGAMILSSVYLSFVTIISYFSNDPIKYKPYSIFILVMFFVSLFRNSDNLKSTFNFSKQVDTSYYTKYTFLKSYVSHKAVILSDELSNWYIPAYNGKVIASAHPLFAISDQNERANAIEDFFKEETPKSRRCVILEKYRPDFLLLNAVNNPLSRSTYLWMEGLGELIYSKNDIRFIKLRSNFYK